MACQAYQLPVQLVELGRGQDGLAGECNFPGGHIDLVVDGLAHGGQVYLLHPSVGSTLSAFSEPALFELVST